MLSKKIKIVIADDHRIFREGLKLMLASVPSIDVIGEAADGAQLIALVASGAPDVIITDVKMPNLTGTEAVKILCAKYPGIRIIALTSFGEDQQIIEMIEAGAMGFLSKNIVHEELVSAINSVYMHNSYFSQSITERLSKIIAQKTTVRHHNASISFTEVEKQIIGLICKELTSKEIAGQLKIGKRTVESYRIRIMDKIGAKSLAGIITYAAGYLPKNQQIA